MAWLHHKLFCVEMEIMTPGWFIYVREVMNKRVDCKKISAVLCIWRVKGTYIHLKLPLRFHVESK